MHPYRSLLFVPAHRPGWVTKALRVGPDAVILDLEDSVPDREKATARDALAAAVAEARAGDPRVGVLVRPNHWNTPEGPEDLAASVEAGPDALLLPKVDGVAELVRIDAVMEYLLRRAGRDGGGPEIVASLETAAGLVACEEIVRAPRVVGALVAAARDGDVARSVGFRWTPEGLETLHYRSHGVLACRAAGAHPVVGLWQDLGDLDGLRAFATANADLGYRGQVVIHPSHVPVVNEAFTPSPATVAFYEGMIAAYEAARAEGRGAVDYEGQHIDKAHVQTARDVVALARRVDRGGA